ncbi:hypothetical protein EV127DRAFT_482990 [Xylaria flabelliformis]|nr:hypothetical protein EV127DRAFT_482990 [Xylaria flabelliformis]
MFLIKSLGRSHLNFVARQSCLSKSAPRTVPCPPLTRSQRFSLRWKTTIAKTEAASKPPTPNYTYPSQLCVYHAGTGRITFLASLKLSTLFIFAFFGFVVTPAYYQNEGLSPDVVRTALCAVVPLAFVAYTTSPFVTFIHMRLPPFARQSEDMLRRYVRTLPPQTELNVTTMSIIAKPRISTVKLSDLAPVSRRFGIVNLARDTASENAIRKWYMFPTVGNFNVQRASGTSKAPWVWDAIWNSVNIKRL